MPHVVGHEGEKPEHRGGGKAVPDDIPDAPVSAPEIDGQRDGDGEGGGEAGEGGGQQAEPAVRAVVGENPGAVGDRFEE